jgi:hypothetical protein
LGFFFEELEDFFVVDLFVSDFFKAIALFNNSWRDKVGGFGSIISLFTLSTHSCKILDFVDNDYTKNEPLVFVSFKLLFFIFVFSLLLFLK